MVRRVALIFDDTLRPETTGVYCRRALEALVEVRHFRPAELERIPRDEFDLYLGIDDGLHWRFPVGLRPRAFWAIDTHLAFERLREKAVDCDFVFAAQRNGAARLRTAGIAQATWLPLACDPNSHRRHEVPKRHDVAFVGNLVPGKRNELLKRIWREFPSSFVGRRYFDEMARAYSEARIVFNRSVADDVNMRVFEAAACGSLLVTNDLASNGQEELFRSGEHLVTYRDGDELVERIAWYLDHGEERERIAAAGREHALREHTYARRMETILRTADRSDGRGRTTGRGRSTGIGGSAATRRASGDPAYYEFARPEVLALIPQTVQRVLEIGCGAGCLGRSIKDRQPTHVVGIEVDPVAATDAVERLDEVRVGDVETMDLDFPAGSFDCVVCADVLEHLRAPEQVLTRARGWLGRDGVLVASLPNVQNLSVIVGLLDGNWTYEPAGLLDETHLRFFTRQGIEQLLGAAGFDLRSIAVVGDAKYHDWLREGQPARVEAGRLRIECAAPEAAEAFFVYQYLVTAAPKVGSLSASSLGDRFPPSAEDAELHERSAAPAFRTDLSKLDVEDFPLRPIPIGDWRRHWDDLMKDAWLSSKLDRTRRLREHLDYVRRHVPGLGSMPPGLVIDLGPGAGELLEIAGRLDHRGLGIDAEPGAGGMGAEYIDACRLVWERQGIEVHAIGTLRFLAGEPAQLPAGEAVLVNSRGSIEQMFAAHLDGPAHEEHHDCRRLAWRVEEPLREAFAALAVRVADLLRPGGIFLVHANGAGRSEAAERLLAEQATRFGLERTLAAPRLMRFVRR